MPLISSPAGTVAGGFAAIIATVLILLGGAATINNQEASTTTDFVLETPETVPDFDTETGADAVGTELPFEEPAEGKTPETGTTTKVENGVPVRQVAPEEFSLPADVEAKPLERIAAREPLSKIEPVEKKAEKTLLLRPLAISAGAIRFGQGLVELDGLSGPTLNRTCAGPDGKTWPCGMMARTALRNFIRGRALTCTVPGADFTGTVTASCELGGKDVALWLAENGWAEPAPGSTLNKLAEEAKAKGLGLFGNDPRGTVPADQPETIATP
ncbi:thermonuclease family protein [Pararhizobium sp.]|uniref:thermonuclease family protein n=1 Tax=Pararhizobium sp. TaxID=1977563 RepID=UPI00271A36FD|nr:thermonuclease family protein [Pararhizobium sp.]MDO9416318.1 thermonuclease family protein [Pararhizobium sp.]